jgi:hypothetical protein
LYGGLKQQIMLRDPAKERKPMSKRLFNDPDEVLTAKDLSQMLGCSDGYASMLLRVGRITAFSLGRLRKTRVKDVWRFIADGGVRGRLGFPDQQHQHHEGRQSPLRRPRAER